MTDQQKQLELIARISDPGYCKQEAQRKKAEIEKLNFKALNETKELIAEMDTANDADFTILNSDEGGAAMNRFRLLPKASKILANKTNQLIFLD